MKLLVNDKELANYLCILIDIEDQCSHIKIDESNNSNVAHSIAYILEKQSHAKFSLEKHRDKFRVINWRLLRGTFSRSEYREF